VNNNIIGARIKYLREENNLSQKQLAHHLNITNVQLSRYETGHRSPDPEMILRIANFFGVMTDYIYGIHEKIYDPQSIYMIEQDHTLVQLLKNNPDLKRVTMEMVEAPDSKMNTFVKIWDLLHDRTKP
jgi:transcriptional regulator with XRE-family HTH domain